MEATQMTQNWMSHHVKQQGLSNAGSSTTGGNESNSQLSGKNYFKIFCIEIFNVVCCFNKIFMEKQNTRFIQISNK